MTPPPLEADREEHGGDRDTVRGWRRGITESLLVTVAPDTMVEAADLLGREGCLKTPGGGEG